ncbi:MAG: site-specific DNA-methyltransferase, partial [Firmicutes bacterium]|nr:site-specific DNA-methyltransferase [Bacillota bacterium]
MARKEKTQTKRPVETYEHRDKERLNNPPVGLVTPDTDPDTGQKAKTYAYDPHLDPQLVWAGKAEHTSFQVPIVSLHVHERIDPRTIIEAVRKRNGDEGKGRQMSLFEMSEENPPLRQAIEFYQHAHGWSNRLVAGDSLLVMNSLLEKEGMAGKVQMIYIDPPYGIKYGSNFQPFVNKRDVKDGKDEDLTAEPEQIRAFRDTWELGIHSYLTYLCDRLLLARELLTESGSVFVQISDENVHRGVNLLSSNYDYVLWYAKEKVKTKYRQLFVAKKEKSELGTFAWIEQKTGEIRRLTVEEMRGDVPLPTGRRFRASDISGQGETASSAFPFEVDGRIYFPSKGRHWSTNQAGMEALKRANRIVAQGQGNNLAYKRYDDDFPVMPLVNVWDDTVIGTFTRKIYVVQTGDLAVQRCILMTTDPGDLVLDPTCGSGTTAYVAEQWGRRWITCDTSRVALTLARQRLMTAVFDYYELSRPQEGVSSGFKYKTVPHVTLKSIANNPDIREGMTREQIDAAIARHALRETLYDQPLVDRKKTRVSGPFTVEAVPAPAVKSIEDALIPTLSQRERCAKAGQYIRFAHLEPLPGCRFLHAEGETRPSDEGAEGVREEGTAYAPQRIVVSFGPEYAPLEQRKVAQAIEEAHTLVPRPKLIVFAAFQFDPEAARDIDETNWPGMTLLKAQMNADLLTDDLKKKRASNESFWLIGQPDVEVERIEPAPQPSPRGRGSQCEGVKYRVSVHGFDYYKTKPGVVE